MVTADEVKLKTEKWSEQTATKSHTAKIIFFYTQCWIYYQFSYKRAKIIARINCAFVLISELNLSIFLLFGNLRIVSQFE
jgi:hypothetical protein